MQRISNNKNIIRKKVFLMHVKDRTLYSDAAYDNYIFSSDIHGTLETLEFIKNAKRDFPKAQFVGGGDYIDGRKYSREVCDFMIEQAHNNSVILSGNHEEMMLDFADGKDIYEAGQEPLWYFNGAKKTIRSFFGRGYSKIKTAQFVKNSKYYEFFKNNIIMYVTPYIIFVHGGIIPDADFDNPAKYDNYDYFRLWARGKYIFNNKTYFADNYTGHAIISGHTPTTYIHGKFQDGRVMPETSENHCNIKIIKNEAQPIRVFTDGGCHSSIPENKGNVTVHDKFGHVIAVYNGDYPNGIAFEQYIEKYGQDNIFGTNFE